MFRGLISEIPENYWVMTQHTYPLTLALGVCNLFSSVGGKLRMATGTSTFASALARAAGLELNAAGEVRSKGKTLYRMELHDEGTTSDDAYFELIDWLRAYCVDDPELVFRYAAEIRNDDLGVLGLAAKSAPTLKDSLLRLERYFRVVTNTAVYRLDDSSEPARFIFDALTPDRPALQLRDECALAAIVSNIRAFGGAGIELDHVSFRHDCRSDPAQFEAFFGCEVRFGTGSNVIAIKRRSLEIPNRLSDRGISDFLTQHLEEEIKQLPTSISLRDEVQRHLSTRLSNGVPQASEVAQEMGMSERTFYRRLANENISYRDVLRDAQLSLAQELLSDSTCSIAEVAFLTGFSEQSTFSRAFKRWVGEPPAKFRQLSL